MVKRDENVFGRFSAVFRLAVLLFFCVLFAGFVSAWCWFGIIGNTCPDRNVPSQEVVHYPVFHNASEVGVGEFSGGVKRDKTLESFKPVSDTGQIFSNKSKRFGEGVRLPERNKGGHFLRNIWISIGGRGNWTMGFLMRGVEFYSEDRADYILESKSGKYDRGDYNVSRLPADSFGAFHVAEEIFFRGGLSFGGSFEAERDY